MTKTMTGKKSERLMKSLYEAQDDLSDLAKREKLTLTRMAHWANEVHTIELLEGLCRLNDARAQLLVSRYRTLAAARLFDLTKDDAGGELARKACVDLLKVSLVPVMERDNDESTTHTPAPIIDGHSIRTILSQMGQEANEPGASATEAGGLESP